MTDLKRSIRNGGNADIAFAVVVMASYFATFSTLTDASALQIILLVALGTIYILFGIYGYAFCFQKNQIQINLLYFALQISIGGLIIYLGRGTGLNALVLLPLVGQSVMLLSPRLMMAVNGIISILFIFMVRFSVQSWSGVWNGLPTFFGGQIFIIIFTQTALEEELARLEVERLVIELEEANQRLRKYAVQVEDLTLTKERNRMAREIHDGLGHYLTVIHMQIQAARAILLRNPQKALNTLDNAQNMTQEALLDVRRSVASLRENPDEVLALPERMERMLQACMNTPLLAEFRMVGHQRKLNPQAELTLFRATQEGMNNTLKHAKARHLWVMLDYSADQWVTLTIRDDGEGTGNVNGGFGLLGIQERVHLLKGECTIQSEPGQGFSIELKVPG